MRVVVFSHGHPRFSKGGGEIAAYYLHQGFLASGQHESWFIARAAGDLLPGGTPLATFAPREYLVAGNANGVDLAATIPLDAGNALERLLREIDPDVIHFHHYFLLGIELLRLAKRACPRARIVLTLHEFVAICLNNGQMVKTDGRLCHRYSPRECHRCFPDRAAESIFARERFVKSFFDLVDLFISPSEFLRQRYIAWGIAPERIVMLENGLPAGERIPPRPLRDGEPRGRFAFFGQIHPFKGVDVILEAFAGLPDEARGSVSLDIFGSGLESQQASYREKVEGLLEKTSDIVRLHGSYEPEEMPRLIAEADWVVMGSIWWENSPVVIQEAYKFGRPVLCPDIGGMAEKVANGVGGYHYRARDAVSLRALVLRLLSDQGRFDAVHGTLPAASFASDVVRAHVQLYRGTPAPGVGQ